MSESKIQADIREAFGLKPDLRLFRNNCGTGWVGRSMEKIYQPSVVRLMPGDVVLRNARPLHAGLAIGSGDLIGGKKLLITADMVGQSVLQFVSVEVKDENGRTTQQQRAWLRTIKELGGIAGIVRSVADAAKLLGYS